MNIFEKLPLLGGQKSADDDAKDIEDQEKRDRVLFHFRSVRNGPVKLKEPTTGQVRRSQARAIRSMQRKVLRRKIRQYKSGQLEASNIGGHLQAVGVREYSFGYKPTDFQVRASAKWLVEHYAPKPEGEEVEVTVDIVAASFDAALRRWQELVGHPITGLTPAYSLPTALFEVVA